MQIGKFFSHLIDYSVNTVPAIRCALASADDGNSMLCIKISLPTNKKHHRGIAAVLQALGIVGVGDGNDAYLVLLAPFLLCLRFFCKMGEVG